MLFMFVQKKSYASQLYICNTKTHLSLKQTVNYIEERLILASYFPIGFWFPVSFQDNTLQIWKRISREMEYSTIYILISAEHFFR